jgi:hypothetical protein
MALPAAWKAAGNVAASITRELGARTTTDDLRGIGAPSRQLDYWTGEPLEIDDKISLASSRPPFGGLRWWFVCPRLNRRVRKLYLPLGGRHFLSRRAYRLAYASQRETVYDRAMRRARKLCLRLGGDPADDEYPDKPPRMRWTTYKRLMDKLVAADGVADERLILLAARWLGR